MTKPEPLLALVERLDKNYANSLEGGTYDHAVLEVALRHEWPRISAAIRAMMARLEDHDCFGDVHGETCGRCAFLARLDGSEWLALSR